MNGKRVLVTGGLGNLGSKVSIHLANLGYEVYVLSRKAKNVIEGIKYTLIEADITNLEDLEKKLTFDIDFCVHTASVNEVFVADYPALALKVNTLGTRNLLDVLSGKNLKHFIYLSTFHVYGCISGTVNEATDLNPKSDYASTHLFAEYYVKQFASTHNVQYTILRLTNSYGCPTFSDSDKWYLVLNDLTRSAFKKGMINISSNGQAKRDFICMDDVAIVVDKLLQKKSGNEIYNLSSGKTFTILELAVVIKEFYEKRYNKNIKIELNNEDKTMYRDLDVSSDKLKSVIVFESRNRISYEVGKIFDLLEVESDV